MTARSSIKERYIGLPKPNTVQEAASSLYTFFLSAIEKVEATYAEHQEKKKQQEKTKTRKTT